MKPQYVTLGYRQYGSNKLLSFSGGVSIGIYDNESIFIDPPFTKADFDETVTKFNGAAADYKKLGYTKLHDFDVARADLIKKLDVTGDFVNTKAAGIGSTIALGGYVPSKTTVSKSTVITTPVEGKALRGPGVMDITTEATAVKNNGSMYYTTVVVLGGPLPEGAFVNGQVRAIDNAVSIFVDSSHSRKKIYTNLPTWSLAYVYYLAFNPSGPSPLGEPTILTTS